MKTLHLILTNHLYNINLKTIRGVTLISSVSPLLIVMCFCCSDHAILPCFENTPSDTSLLLFSPLLFNKISLSIPKLELGYFQSFTEEELEPLNCIVESDADFSSWGTTGLIIFISLLGILLASSQGARLTDKTTTDTPQPIYSDKDKRKNDRTRLSDLLKVQKLSNTLYGTNKAYDEFHINERGYLNHARIIELHNILEWSTAGQQRYSFGPFYGEIFLKNDRSRKPRAETYMINVVLDHEL